MSEARLTAPGSYNYVRLFGDMQVLLGSVLLCLGIAW